MDKFNNFSNFSIVTQAFFKLSIYTFIFQMFSFRI